MQWATNELLRKQHEHNAICEGQLELYDARCQAFNTLLDLKCNVCDVVQKCSTVPPQNKALLATQFYMGTVAAGKICGPVVWESIVCIRNGLC